MTRELAGSDPPSDERLVIEASRSRTFSGPLPPPESLAKYNEVVPGAADRIVAMAERQLDHRLKMEDAVIRSNISAQRLGVILGFTIVMTAIVGGIYLAAMGRSAIGLASIITALISLAGVFVYARQAQQKELSQKANSVKLAQLPRRG